MGYFDSIYAAELSHRAVAVYMYLKSRANKDGVCWPGIRTISVDLNLSRSTVQRALRDLQGGGWIKIEPRYRENGSSSSNRYYVQ